MSDINIFVVDDHGIVRHGLKLLIDTEPQLHVVGESASGAGLVEPVRASAAHVVVMDISMPGLDGASATLELRKALPDVKIIGLTRHTEPAYVLEMTRAGASGYVLKQSGIGTLVSAIHAVMDGGTYIDPAIAGSVLEAFNRIPSSPTRPASVLTPREQQIATMVAHGNSNKEIAAKLTITVKTVEAHKTNIMTKLNLASRAELVEFALAHGWVHRS